MTHTAPKIIMAHTQSCCRTIIAEDTGQYPGTVDSLNVRKLRILHELDLSCRNPVARAICDRGEGYGCGWGDTSKLYPITGDDVTRLIAEDQRLKRERKDKRQREIASAVPEWRSPRGLTLTDEMDSPDSDY